MATRDAVIRLLLDNRKYQKSLKESESRTKRFFRAADKWAGRGVIAFVTLATTALKSFHEMSKGSYNLQAALHATGKATEVNQKRLEKAALAIEETSLFNDDQAKLVQAALVRLSETTEEQIVDLSRVTADFAATWGLGFEEAAQRVGRLFASPEAMLGGFRRFGIVISKEQRARVQSLIAEGKRVEALQFGVDLLKSKYAGASQAQVQGTGKLILIYQSIENILGRIGKRIWALVEPTATWADEFLNKIKSNDEELDRLSAQVIALGKHLLATFVGLKIGAAVVLLAGKFRIATAGVKAFSWSIRANAIALRTWMATNPIGWVTLLIGGLVELALNWDWTKHKAISFGESVSLTFLKIQRAYYSMWEKIGGLAEKLPSWLGGGRWIVDTEKVRQNIREVEQEIIAAQNRINAARTLRTAPPPDEPEKPGFTPDPGLMPGEDDEGGGAGKERIKYTEDEWREKMEILQARLDGEAEIENSHRMRMFKNAKKISDLEKQINNEKSAEKLTNLKRELAETRLAGAQELKDFQERQRAKVQAAREADIARAASNAKLLATSVMGQERASKIIAGIEAAQALRKLKQDLATKPGEAYATTVGQMGFWGIASAILASAAVAMQIKAAISGIRKFREGGIVPGNPLRGDAVPAMLQAGEGVIPRDLVSELRNMARQPSGKLLIEVDDVGLGQFIHARLVADEATEVI